MSHLSRRSEIDLFKRHINLSEFAAAEGYALDRQHSSRNFAVMRGPNGDKIGITIARKTGHWIYCNAYDKEDSGTIIDFLFHRTDLSMGDIRKKLRPWIGLPGDPPKRPPVTAYQQTITPVGRVPRRNG